MILVFHIQCHVLKKSAHTLNQYTHQELTSRKPHRWENAVYVYVFIQNCGHETPAGMEIFNHRTDDHFLKWMFSDDLKNAKQANSRAMRK